MPARWVQDILTYIRFDSWVFYLFGIFELFFFG